MRGIAEVLVSLYGENSRSVIELMREEPFRRLAIAEINSIGRMHPFLADHPRLSYSEYPEEDLMNLSYPDASFDLVLTSDTLEHVPDPVSRCARPGACCGRAVGTCSPSRTTPVASGRARGRGFQRNTTAAAAARSPS